MGDTPAKVAQATAKAIGEQEKKPPPLNRGERFIAGLLFLAGLIVIGVTLFAFSTSDSDFTFKQKEKAITEPAAAIVLSQQSKGTKVNCGTKPTRKARKQCRKRQRQKVKAQKPNTLAPVATAGSTKTKASPVKKVTTEVEYSDSVAIAALGIGAAMAIGGGFYGRIRSLKFLGGEADFVGPDLETKATLEQKTEQKVEEQGITDPEKKAAVAVGAQKVAIAQLRTIAASGVEPTEMIIEGVTDQAVADVAEPFLN